jgi:hypothetical protein
MLNGRPTHFYSIFLHVILLLSISSALMIGFYEWPIADDFCNMSRLRDVGIYEFTSHAYQNWTGRIFTTYILASVLAFVPIELTNYVIVIQASMFIASVWFAIGWLNIEGNFIEYKKKNYFLLFFLIFYLFLTYSHVVGEAVYWLTGSIVYVTPLFLLTATKPFLEWISKKISYSLVKFSAIFIWFLFLGNSIELLTIPSFFMTFYLLYKASFPALEKRKFYLASLLGYFVGTCVLIFSPGNYSRAASVHKNIIIDFSSIIINFIKTLKILATSMDRYSFVSVYPIILIILGIITFFVCRKSNSLKNKTLKINYLNTIFFFCIAYLSYIPMIFAVDFFANRTFIYFFFFHTISSIYLIKQFFLFLKFNVEKSIFYVSLALFSLFSFKLAPQFQEARIANQNFLIRHNHLLESRGEDVSVNKIVDPKKVSNLYVNDISIDRTHWINSCLSEYYELKSVRLLE